MISVLHRVPSPSSQLAEEVGDVETIAVSDLQWTKEELEANLITEETEVLLDNGMLADLEAFGTLTDVLIDVNDVPADILNQSLWMDAKLFPDEVQQTSLPEALYTNTVNNGAYTPPQTPPYEHQQQYNQVATSTESFNVVPQNNQQQDLGYLMIPMDIPVYTAPTHPNDVARELAVVDELVRTCASGFVPSSPSSASNSSSCSMSSDCSSSDDLEWSNDFKPVLASRRRTKSKPYAATLDEKRSRKKEQNKNAATRYRMKKKAEVAEIQLEEHALEQVKIGLEAKIEDLDREISCLKGLMKDFFLKKGLIE